MNLVNRLRDIKQNPQLLPFYAKGNCKHCYGRGVEHITVPQQTRSQTRLCSCVTKAIQREIRELQNG